LPFRRPALEVSHLHTSVPSCQHRPTPTRAALALSSLVPIRVALQGSVAAAAFTHLAPRIPAQGAYPRGGWARLIGVARESRPGPVAGFTGCSRSHGRPPPIASLRRGRVPGWIRASLDAMAPQAGPARPHPPASHSPSASMSRSPRRRIPCGNRRLATRCPLVGDSSSAPACIPMNVPGLTVLVRGPERGARGATLPGLLPADRHGEVDRLLLVR
jgi:hypothetical protein